MTSEHARLEKESKEEQEKIKQLPVLNQLLTQMSLQNDVVEPCSEKPDQSLPQKGQTDTGMTQASSSGPNQKPLPERKKTIQSDAQTGFRFDQSQSKFK